MQFLYAIALSFFFLFSLSAQSKGPCSDDGVMLEEGQEYKGDYFIAGSSVEISGIIEGDAYVAAGQAIIDGVVKGDLLIVCGSAEISGKVLGNIRILGGQVTLSGPVGGSITLVAGNAQLSPASVIQGSAIVVSANGDVLGKIHGNAKLLSSNLEFTSHVDGDVTAYVGEMRVSSKGYIGGALNYRSTQPAIIDRGAEIRGPIDYHPSFLQSFIDWPWLKGLIIGSKILALLMNFIFTLVFGWILIRLFPSKLSRTVQVLDHQPLHCLTTGLVVLVAIPLLCLILLITVLGAPFALALIALNILGFYTAKIFVVMWIASKGLQKYHIKRGRLATLALGLIAYYLITVIPFVGTFVSLLALLCGMGAIVLAQREQHLFLPPSR
jgi:hypothetical protein